MNIIEGGLSFNLMIYYNSSFSNGIVERNYNCCY